MSMNKHEMRNVRVVINRAAIGPPFLADSISDPNLQAVLRELQNQTRAWLQSQIIGELQRMLPPNERVKL